MSALLHKAIAAHQSGNLAEAEMLYRDVLEDAPDEADALALLGVALDARGEADQAIALIEKAVRLDPRAALFRIHLGNALMTAERFAESAVAFQQAVVLQPNLPQAHFNLGNALRKAEDWGSAIAAYREAVRLNPAYAEAYNNLALALIHEKYYDEAVEQARKSTEIAPHFGEAWLTLCNVAEQVKDYETARVAGERVTQLMPNDHKSWFGYGVALNRLGRHEEAIEVYKRALALKPERADIWDNLGQTYQSLNRLDEAEAIFRKTVEVAGQVIADEDTREVAEEEYGNRHWHLALMELLRGKYKQGFARYRAQFEDVGDLKRPDYSQPLWRGENLAGKTILIRDEQGFGDTLMFCRYLPLLKEQGARILFSVHPALEALFNGWNGIDQTVVHGGTLPPFDFHATTFDLPHRFGTTLETIPATVPYLPLLEVREEVGLEGFLEPSSFVRTDAPQRPSPPEGEDRWGVQQEPRPVAGCTTTPHQQKLRLSEEAKPKFLRPPPQGGRGIGASRQAIIGVVWGGSPLHKNDENRSIPLGLFSGIFFEQSAQFYSFNRDMKPGDAELLPRLPVIDLAPRLKNFADNARFMRQCDLIITCDTATAHLAGGLGLPVWTLLPFAPDWRWLTDRSDSPWYPTMRLFRQARAGDWVDVMGRVRDALCSEIKFLTKIL